jgi:hypothetical protein
LPLLDYCLGAVTKSTPRGMKFLFDFEDIKVDSSLEVEKIAWAVQNVTNYISAAVKTYPYAFTVPILASSCGPKQLPSNVSGTYTDIDLIVVVSPSSSLGSYPAKGYACHYDSANINRPVVGVLVLNKTL